MHLKEITNTELPPALKEKSIIILVQWKTCHKLGGGRVEGVCMDSLYSGGLWEHFTATTKQE